MPTQAALGGAFEALHERTTPFVIANPWDAGSARILEALGFEALATSSAGFAFSEARPDLPQGPEALPGLVEHVRTLTRAAALPLSVDLQDGYAATPEGVGEAIRAVAEAGAVGASIEDARPGPSLYPLALAVERVRAAVEAARDLDVPFVLTARAETMLFPGGELSDAIERLQAYQEAGADVLFAPGLVTRAQIAEVRRSVDLPLNVLMGGRGERLSVAELGDLGVVRVSVGSAFCRAAYGAFLSAAREVLGAGTFEFTARAASFRELNGFFE